MSTVAPTFARPAPAEVSSATQAIALRQAIRRMLELVTVEDVIEQLADEAAQAALIVATNRRDHEMLALVWFNVRMAYALRLVQQEGWKIAAPDTAAACAMAVAGMEVV